MLIPWNQMWHGQHAVRNEACCGSGLLASVPIQPNERETFYSGFLGGYWTAQDYMVFMASEKVPTKIRGSVLGGLNLLQYIGIFTGMFALTIAQVFISDEWIGVACAISAIPGMIAAMFLIMRMTKETKGTDLESLDEQAEAALTE